MSFWEGLSEAVGEAWDVVIDNDGEVLKKVIQTTKESAADPDKLRESEPEKGKNPDGSTVVAPPAQTAMPVTQTQYIEGVDNKVTIAGGAVVSLVLLVLVVKMVK